MPSSRFGWLALIMLSLLVAVAANVFLPNLSKQSVSAQAVFNTPLLNLSAKDMLRQMNPQHPRLHLTPAIIASLQIARKNDPKIKLWYQRINIRATRMMGEAPPAYVKAGPRLDPQRMFVRRIITFSLVALLENDPVMAQRAIDDMLLISNFPDWNYRHFLDAAELTQVLSLGLDWLDPFIKEQDKEILMNAIVEKGLEPGLTFYRKQSWWVKQPTNWNFVCNDGMLSGALAIAEYNPELASQVLRYSAASILTNWKSYANGGGWGEGTSYWNYGSMHHIAYLDALKTTMGSMFGLESWPGLDTTAWFRIYTLGPTGQAFNFGDSGENPATAPQLFWLAQTYKQPFYQTFEEVINPQWFDPYHLIWYNFKTPKEQTQAAEPLDKAFENTGVVTLRSAWQDKNAWFFGVKGGTNTVGHGHLDLGSFVLDAMGERWLTDMGPENYNVPNYFVAPQRYAYYRVGTSGHNTFRLNDENQSPKADAALSGLKTLNTASPKVQLALSQTYPDLLAGASRSFDFPQRNKLEVTDKLNLKTPATYTFTLHTAAKVTLVDSKHVTLLLNGKQLNVSLGGKSSAQFAPCQIPNEALAYGKLKLNCVDVVAKLPQGNAEVKTVFSSSP